MPTFYRASATGSPDTPEQIRDKLETLTGENRLVADAIRDGTDNAFIDFSTALTFSYWNVQAGLSNEILALEEGFLNDGLMPKNGYIIGSALQLDNNLLAGSLSVIITKNDIAIVDTSLNLSLNTITQKNKSANIGYGISDFVFAKDDRIGARLTSSVDYLPLTNNLTLNVFVQFD